MSHDLFREIPSLSAELASGNASWSVLLARSLHLMIIKVRPFQHAQQRTPKYTHVVYTTLSSVYVGT